MEDRFSRNIPAITPEAQSMLRSSHVCVAGCGGLGGYLIEFLARAGVGQLTLIDADSFEPSNLNRQCLSTTGNLGIPKTTAAVQRVNAIDPKIHVNAKQVFLDDGNADILLSGTDLVIDALDSASSRRTLAASCQRLGIPLIHGAIQGWNAQIAVFMPDDPGLTQLYPEDEPDTAAQPDTSAAKKSCLSFTPALCAAVQCAEAVKLLTKEEPALKSRLLLADLRYMDFMTVEL